jgi:hypothetical protein
MRYLLTALAISIIAPQTLAAETIVSRDLAYARCLMQAFEHGINGGEVQEIYLVACMRVAGYEPAEGGLKGGADFKLAKGS